MGIWRTNENPRGYNVNIINDQIAAMKRKGAVLCWIRDNPGICDETSDYFEDVSEGEKSKGNKQGIRRRKEHISVVDADGNTIEDGYIAHMVNGPCFGTNICDWFIFQPGSYPTYYNIKSWGDDDVVITDL